MRPVNPSTESTASIVTNFTTAFTPVVDDHSTKETTESELPEGLSIVKCLTTKEEKAKVIPVLVWERFSFTLLKNSELEDQLTYYFTR